MSPELDKKLCEKHSNIFVNRNKSAQESCMYWGFECGDGWYNLIDTLCEAITYTFTTSVEVDEEDGKRLGIEPNRWAGEEKNRYFFKVEAPQVIADQVKEKFGTLRFYYHLDYDEKNLDLIKTGKYPDLDMLNRRYADYIDGIVHFAEIASARICEVTGASGEMHIRGNWLKVISRDIAKTEPYDGYKIYNSKNYET